MTKILFLAAALSSAAFGAAQAQNYTVPAGDAGFAHGHDVTSPNETRSSGFQAFVGDHASDFNQVVVAPFDAGR